MDHDGRLGLKRASCAIKRSHQDRELSQGEAQGSGFSGGRRRASEMGAGVGGNRSMRLRFLTDGGVLVVIY